MYWNEFQWVGGRTRSAHWALAPIVPPTIIEPITVAQARKHLRIAAADDDDQIVLWIRAARQQVEKDTGLLLPTQTLELSLDAYPAGTYPLSLLTGPIQSVTTLKYYDSAGVLQTWSSTNYLVDTASIPGRIGLTATGSWPTDLRRFQPGLIRFVGGYVDAASTPEPLLHAMRLLMACSSEERGPSSAERGTYERLIEPYALMTAV